MSDVTCRGSFALGTACGRCSQCKAQIEEYRFKKTVRERLDGTAAFKSQIAALEARLAEVEKGQIMLRAERDGLASLLLSVQQESIGATTALATARRDALEEAAKVCQRISNTDLAATNPPYEEGYSDAADACFHAIRALITQEEPTT